MRSKVSVPLLLIDLEERRFPHPKKIIDEACLLAHFHFPSWQVYLKVCLPFHFQSVPYAVVFLLLDHTK